MKDKEFLYDPGLDYLAAEAAGELLGVKVDSSHRPQADIMALILALARRVKRLEETCGSAPTN